MLLPVPRYKELGVKPLWAFVKEVPELLQYFPNLEKDELPDRFFMWTILYTLRYDQWKQLISDARSARSKSDKNNNDELIEIDPEFLNKLISTPMLSTSKQKFWSYSVFIIGNGRVAYLLKSARKAKVAKKKPKEFQSNLAVLKSDKKDKTKTISRSNLYEEEEKKEADDMNVDATQWRRDNSSFGTTPPPKDFSSRKFSSKQSQGNDDERIEF